MSVVLVIFSNSIHAAPFKDSHAKITCDNNQMIVGNQFCKSSSSGNLFNLYSFGTNDAGTIGAVTFSWLSESSRVNPTEIIIKIDNNLPVTISNKVIPTQAGGQIRTGS